MTHPSIPTALVARDLVKTYADRTVLDGVDLVAPPRRVVAVIGENGSGKSTLLRLLAGTDEPDSGTIQRPQDLAHLAQELEGRCSARSARSWSRRTTGGCGAAGPARPSPC